MKYISNETFIVPEKAKWAFTARRINRSEVSSLNRHYSSAVSGDLVLAQVEKIGQHQRIQLTSGRPSKLNVGDYVVLCCGARYAPDQFEGQAEISDYVSADMLASGGLIGKANQSHHFMSTPTQLKPVGLLQTAEGKIMNAASYALPAKSSFPNMVVIGVVGAIMNSGKTTATAALAHGLTKAGYKVAGLKATGTGAFGDYNALVDAGLHYVADFTDAGMVSTYQQPLSRIESGLCTLLSHAAQQGAEIAVVEFADGIYQQETAQLLKSSTVVRDFFSGFMYTCTESISAVGGVNQLEAYGWRPFAVSGLISCSPLATEEAEKRTGVATKTREALMSAEVAELILSEVLEAEINREYVA